MSGGSRRVAWLVGLSTASVLAACESPENNVLTVTTEEYGEVLFDDPRLSDAPSNEVSCGTCHAKTEGDTSRVWTGAPMPGVTARPSYWGGSEIDLLRSINHCRYYFMSASAPWTGEEPEAVAIYAFLASLEGDESAQAFQLGAVANPGAGDAARGADVYARACASCHGQRGTGAGALVPFADVLPDGTLAAHPPPKYDDADRRLVFVEKTRSGAFRGYGGTMPPFSVEALSDEDLAALLTFLEVP